MSPLVGPFGNSTFLTNSKTSEHHQSMQTIMQLFENILFLLKITHQIPLKYVYCHIKYI